MVVQYLSSDANFLITVGENAKENDSIRKKASQSDLWFHLEDVSSPHVMLSEVKKSKNGFSREAIYEAASLCKAYSKQKTDQSSSVIWCKRKDVKNIVEIDGRVELKGHVEKLRVFRDDTIKETLKKM